MELPFSKEIGSYEPQTKQVEILGAAFQDGREAS